MNEKLLELQLLDNPKYSSGWIENAVHLMCKCGLSEEELSRFTTEQLQLIVSMFTSAEQNPEIWIDGFLNPELNATQMQVLLTAYSHGLTTEQIKLYFNPEIPYVKSNWILAGLAEGIDITSYDVNAYNKDQIYEIYAGKKDGVDVSIYDDVEIPAEIMALARHALVLGLKPQFDENKKLTI
jgi:hypothetical protein